MWQTIETAPLDTEVLVSGYRYGRHGGLRWMSVARLETKEGPWNDGSTSLILPTHWMPLPPPPQGSPWVAPGETY